MWCGGGCEVLGVWDAGRSCDALFGAPTVQCPGRGGGRILQAVAAAGWDFGALTVSSCQEPAWQLTAIAALPQQQHGAVIGHGGI